MGDVSSLARFQRTARCLRALQSPALFPLLMLALPHVIWTQETTQLRQFCAATSSSFFCCTGGSSESDSRVRTQLASVVSAFRESEYRITHLGINLTAAVDRYRADVSASSELAEQSVGRLSLKHDDLDNRLAVLSTALHNGLQRASIAANSELLAVQNVMSSNMSSLADTMASEHQSTNQKINANADRISRLFTITGQQTAAISKLNQTQHHIGAIGTQQVSALGVQLNSMKIEMVGNISSLAVTVASERNSTNEQFITSSNQIAKLFILTDQQKSAISHLNETQHQMDVLRRQQASEFDVQLISLKGEMAGNWSSLANDLKSVRNSVNDGLQVWSDRMATVTTVVNQHSTAIGNLNRTLQEIDVSWKQQVLNLSAYMNLLSSKWTMVPALSRFIEQQMYFSTRILVSTVTAVCSMSRDVMASVPQCQSVNSFSSTMMSYMNDVASEIRTLRQQVASDDTALTDNQESLQRRSASIQRELDTFTANVSQRATRVQECKVPWVSYNNSCYFFGSKRLSQEKANSFCMRFRGYLVRVDDISESNFLRDNMLLYDMDWAWIGLVRHVRESRFVWSTGGPYSYAAWLPGEPNNGANYENCVQMLRLVNEDDCRGHNVAPSNCQRCLRDSLNWIDIQCGPSASFICERQL